MKGYRRNNQGQFVKVPFSQSKFDGLKLMIGTIMLGAVINYLYTPVKPIRPIVGEVVVHAIEQVPQPTTKALTVDSVVDAIWMLESSRGTTGNPGSLQYYCHSRGMWNELGYGGMKLKICFKNKEEGFARVIKWVNKYYEKHELNLARTLCYYNLGLDQPDCKYYQDYLKIQGAK